MLDFVVGGFAECIEGELVGWSCLGCHGKCWTSRIGRKIKRYSGRGKMWQLRYLR